MPRFLDPAARTRLVVRFGKATVEPWWRELPSRLEDLAERWDVEIGDPVGHDWVFCGTDDPREWARRCHGFAADPERVRLWCAAFYPARVIRPAR